MPTIKQGWHEVIISHRVGMYRNLLDLVDRQIEKDLKELTQEAGKASSQLEDDYGHEDYLLDAYLEREEYKGIFLHAFFASSFALFEHELVRICERACREAKSPFSVKDFGRRDYMNNVKNYLKKLSVDFPAGTPEWKQATEYRTIRNKIMHEGGALGENDGIIDFAKQYGILGDNSSSAGNKELKLQLTSDFCEKALNNFQKVLVQVNSAYQQWLQERTP